MIEHFTPENKKLFEMCEGANFSRLAVLCEVCMNDGTVLCRECIVYNSIAKGLEDMARNMIRARPNIHEVVRDAMDGVPECEDYLRRRG